MQHKLGAVVPLILKPNGEPTTTQSLVPAGTTKAWLATWGEGPLYARNPVPLKYREAILAELKEAEADLMPCSPEAFAVGLRKLLNFFRLYKMAVDEDPKPLLEDYREHLSYLPADLWLLAVQRTTGNWKYQGPPKPINFKESIAGELRAKNRRRNLAQTALMKLKMTC